MLCEMCGKDALDVNTVKVEGAVLHLCADCSRFGTAVDPPPLTRNPGSRMPSAILTSPKHRTDEKDIYADMPEMELDEDWSQKIRRARELRGLTQEQFGTLLREKSSVIHKLESGEIVPPDALVRKIERAIKVRLRAPSAPS